MIGRKNSKKYMSDINVTPLVDVMLVLLIIFMVTAPMMTQGVKVNLPKTTSKNIKTSEEPLVLTITQNKEIFLENHKLSLDGLDVKIAKIFENRRDKEVLIRADKDVTYGFVIQVMAMVKKAGINKLGMVTEPLK
ncbi:MAG TPA: protein TolR [Desulfobacteraceae bacterium]|nr:protein TolR [Deltaproteobacteria bacterium]HDM09698.1 protein TolR [Desulfobacteraceae bacterium]